MRTLEKLFGLNERNLRDLSSARYDTLQEAKDAINRYWDCFSLADMDVNPDQEFYLSKLLDMVIRCNDIEFSITESRERINFLFLLKHLLGFGGKIIHYDIQITEKLVSDLRSRFSEADKIAEMFFANLNEINNFKNKELTLAKAGQINENGFEIDSAVESFHQLLFDVYSTKEETVSATIIRDVERALYELGFEIVDYNGENDREFKIRYYPDLRQPKVISPSIRRISDQSIVCKGILNKSK